MSNKVLQLEGIYETPNAEDGRGEWMRDKRKLEEELLSVSRERDDLSIEKERLERSLRNLRQQLSPLHRALRALFGEIELAVGEEQASPAAPGAPQTATSVRDPRWESYKQSLPGVPASIIDALFSHPQMTYMQLAKLLHRDYSTIKNAAAKLKQAGAIVKEGTMCRLNR